MLNKLLRFIRQNHMLQPGDSVVCAVSGGADSMSLLWAMYLLKEKLQISVSAAHFNHCLRENESDEDEFFVRDFCQGYQIPLFVGRESVKVGEKGLEAAARDARYRFFATLPGKVLTAHTADDNAETVLMHMIRGSGLKGLGGIPPVKDKYFRPMLLITRDEVLHFVDQEHIAFREDSTNKQDLFFRNRIRHNVMPMLRNENPQISVNLSAMALHLREEELLLDEQGKWEEYSVSQLRQMLPARRRRVLRDFLVRSGISEPEAEHVSLVESIVFSQKPSARAQFPGGVLIGRNYDRLEKYTQQQCIAKATISCPGTTVLPELGLRVLCRPATIQINDPDRFTVRVVGRLVLRSRMRADTIRLSGGTRTLKKVFIDRKIPAAQRCSVPVLADDSGVVGVYGIGACLDHLSCDPAAFEIVFEKI